MPLRGVLLGIFFTAVGMFFSPAQVAEAPGTLVLDVLAIVVGKAHKEAASPSSPPSEQDSESVSTPGLNK